MQLVGGFYQLQVDDQKNNFTPLETKYLNLFCVHSWGNRIVF